MFSRCRTEEMRCGRWTSIEIAYVRETGVVFVVVVDAPLPQVARERELDEVAHHALDVTADVSDLRELGGLDLDERRLGQLGEPTGDFGFAASGGPHQDDVFRGDLVAQLFVDAPTPPAVAQRDGDRALGVVLPDDEPVKLGDHFSGGK